MSKKAPAFNGKRVNRLARDYAKHPSKRIRNKILVAILPLINAAMIRRNVPKENRDDVRQECVVKLLTDGIPKFNVEKGKSFAFFWTVICNTIATQKQRAAMLPPFISLTAEEDSDGNTETDAIGADLFKTPESQHVLDRVTKALEKAFDEGGFRIPDNRKHRAVFLKLKKAIQNGDLFYNQVKAMKDLKKTGLKYLQIRDYLQYTIVTIRKNLLDAGKELDILKPKL